MIGPRSVHGHRRVAGFAALAAAAIFLTGFVLAVTVVSGSTLDDPEPAEAVAFLSTHEIAVVAWQSITLMGFGIVLAPLVLVLDQELNGSDPLVTRVATAFGILWAGLVLAAGMLATIGVHTVTELRATDPTSATTAWSALHAVQEGLGGGNEVFGGLWVLLLSAAAGTAGIWPKAIRWLGVAAGAVGRPAEPPVLRRPDVRTLERKVHNS